jgi:hypothetical protein
MSMTVEGPRVSAYLAVMRDCANTPIGVWPEHSLGCIVVVAVYWQPGDVSH